jgi:hypothetical protein
MLAGLGAFVLAMLVGVSHAAPEPSESSCPNLFRGILGITDFRLAPAVRETRHVPASEIANLLPWVKTKFFEHRSLKLPTIVPGNAISGNSLAYHLKTQVLESHSSAFAAFVDEFSEFLSHRVQSLKRVESSSIEYYELELNTFYVLKPMNRVLERAQVLSYLLIEFIGVKNSRSPELFEKTMQLKKLVHEPVVDAYSFQAWLESVAVRNPAIGSSFESRDHQDVARRHVNEAFAALGLAQTTSSMHMRKPRIFFAPEVEHFRNSPYHMSPSFDFVIRTSNKDQVIGSRLSGEATDNGQKSYGYTFVEVKEVSGGGGQRGKRSSFSRVARLVGEVLKYKVNGLVLPEERVLRDSRAKSSVAQAITWKDLDAKLVLLVRIPWVWTESQQKRGSRRVGIVMDHLGDSELTSFRTGAALSGDRESNVFVRLANKIVEAHGVQAELNSIVITDYTSQPLAVIKLRGEGRVILRDGRIYQWDAQKDRFILHQGPKSDFSFDQIDL